jgi:hypothetical protein
MENTNVASNKDPKTATAEVVDAVSNDGATPDTALPIEGTTPPAIDAAMMAELIARLEAAESRAATAEQTAAQATRAASEIAQRARIAEEIVEQYRSGEDFEDPAVALTDEVWVRPKGDFEFIYGGLRFEFKADRRVRIPREVANYLKGTHGYEKATALYE